ncbi:MAG TPA: hypothetical protein VMK65_06055 [Longimicrobiales bacterium]|nr:hypothetical protein [Longimicrobiales bacterium]
MRMAGTMLMWGGVGVMALVALKMLMAVVGLVVGLFSFLIFTVLPLVLLGWVVWKVVQWATKPPETTTDSTL